MPGRIHKADPVLGVFQERTSRRARFQDPTFTLDAKLVFNAAALGDELDQRRRVMGVELIGDDYPTRLRIGIQDRFDVSGEIGFGARWTDRRADELTGGHVEVGDQTQGAVAPIFELNALDPTRSNRLGLLQMFTGLHSRFLIDTHHVRALPCKLGGLDPMGRYTSHSVSTSAWYCSGSSRLSCDVSQYPPTAFPP